MYLKVERVQDREYPIVFSYFHSGNTEGPKSFWYSDRQSFNLTLGFVTKCLKGAGHLPLARADYSVSGLLRDEEEVLHETLALPWESIPSELKTDLAQKVVDTYNRMTTTIRKKKI